ncbi:hypothetical protein HRI_002774300 [Hibiscus trionum]|uniref:Retrotransposon gag domain-containing protein n=1 Tax=Hibiscus trionum TaxID=183268 RepID=A0A9W7I6Y4_HIBTR|nr:hypothetical protein HRI_002774300 [Hibiscus trionum]
MTPQGNTEVPPTDRETRQGAAGKKRESSRDLLSSMEKRVARLETAMGNVQDTLEEADPRLKLIDTIKEEVQGIIDDSVGTMNEKIEAFQDAMDAVKAEFAEEIKKLSIELLLYKNAVVNGMVGEAVVAKPRIDVPKLKEFKGSRAAQEVDNFIWGLEQYFRLMNIDDDSTKVNQASVYLTDAALLWWRHRCAQVEEGTLPMKTWKEFMFEFKEHFYPKNAQEEAREKLRQLKHDGNIREYVKRFTELRLQIQDMGEADAFYAFKSGLRQWVKLELNRIENLDLTKAMATAESLSEFEHKRSDATKEKPRYKGSKDNPTRNESERSGKPPNFRRPLDRGRPFERNNGEFKCYTCGGKHLARNCPNDGKVAAIQEKRGEEKIAHVNSIIRSIESK